MPRYYFHLQDGNCRVRADNDGIVLPDIEAAWYQAYRCAAGLDRRCGKGPVDTSFLAVEDEAGFPLMALQLQDLAPVPV